MAECGNMPDWHPYNGPQGVRGSSQNPSTSHMFISSISPGSLDGMNLSTDSRHQSSKHHQGGGGGGGSGVVVGVGGGGGGDGSSYMSRNYPPVVPLASSNCPTSSSITSAGVHMSGLSSCVSHYSGSATQPRNSMLDNSMDPRMVSAMSEESHRPPQIPFPVSASHQSTGINVNPGNAIHGNSTIPPQNSPVGSMSPGRQTAAFSTCKAPCCNPDATLPYQHWEKYNNYHGTTTNTNPYRDNLRQSAYPPLDNRRYHPEMNLRKDCLETNKDLEVSSPFPLDHRRSNFSDYKYRKDSVLPRNYPPNAAAANLLQNYSMQNYNFPNDYQKCPYSVKDYIRRGNTSSSISSKNSGHFKYQEQQQIAQQKYQKQIQYQNGSVMTPLQNSNSTTSSVSSSLQNSYYNPSQVSREIARDYSRDYQQEQSRIAQVSSSSSAHGHGSFQKYQQVYHQKIAMQRYSVENHLRAFSRIPGYQSHPKYQECVMRYRELLRLQQTVDYQNVLQDAPKIPSPSNALAPINLQFDQNGVLINTSYIPPGYTGGIHGTTSTIPSTENPENSRITTNLEVRNTFPEQTESVIKVGRDLERTHQNVVPPSMQENPERFFMTRDKNSSETNAANGTLLNSIGVDEVNKTNDRPEIALSTTVSAGETTESGVEYNNSKDFADKPELDVRQFLANWDESEDEENAATNLTEAAGSASGDFDETVFHNSVEKNVTSQDNCNVERVNKDENSVLVTQEIENQTVTTNEQENSRLDTSDNQSEALTKEIECVRSEEDDIPTIHIVDSLEEGSEIEKIHTVFGSLASAVLNPIAIGENSANNLAKGETIVLFEQSDGICAKTLEFSVEPVGNASEVVEGVIASIIDSSAVETSDSAQTNKYKSPEAPKDNNNSEESDQTISPASSSPDSTFNTSNSVSSTSSISSKSNNNEESSTLRKQSSFNIDESHNPDDISLPDLQTLECTPISTTLNTPTHSDSEESSEHVTDLTISTNPIEIIQNSPIISFTHSPIKIEPYEQLENTRIPRQDSRQREPESLDFDFDRECARRENEKYNETNTETSVDGLEDIREPYEVKNSIEQREESFYGDAEPIVGITEISGDKEHDKNDNTEVESHAIINDQEILQRERDFRRTEELEKLCDISLDGSCMIPLIPEEEEDCDEPRMPVPPMEGNCLTKILNDTLPITDLDVLESSDEGKLEKPEDDVWVDVRYMETDIDGNLGDKIKSDTRKLRKENKKREKLLRQTEKIDKTRNYVASTSVESEVDERISSTERENSEEDFTSSETLKFNAKFKKKDFSEESKKSKDSRRRRISKVEKQILDTFEDNKIVDGRSDADSSSVETSMTKNQKEDYFEKSRKSKDSRRRRLFTEDELEDDIMAYGRRDTDANFSSGETLKLISKQQKEDYFKESRKSKDSRKRRLFTEDELEDDKRADERSDRDENFSSTETLKSIGKDQREYYFEESRKSKDLHKRRLFREDEIEDNKMVGGRSNRDENLPSIETLKSIAMVQKESYFEESRKLKDLRKRRVSRENNLEYNRIADERVDRDENFTSTETLKSITKEQKEDYFEESRISKDLRTRRVSREDNFEYNKMADEKSDRDEYFASAETSQSIAKERKEDYIEESRKSKDSLRRRVSREDDLEYNKMADGRSNEDDYFASAEASKSIAKDQTKGYYEESRKLKDLRKRRVSREDDLENNKMADGRSNEDDYFASAEGSKSIVKHQTESYYEESRKLKDLRMRRVSREDDLKDNKMADARSDEDDNFASVETPKLIPKEQKEDYFEKSRKSKDFRTQRVSREDELEDNKMADARSDEDENFGSLETPKSISKEQNENCFEKSRKSKDFRRQRVSREDDVEDNKMADARGDEDDDCTSVETPKSISKEQKVDYFEESRKLKDSRGQRVSREDDLEDNKMADARSDEDDDFTSVETPKSIAKEQKEDYFEKSRKSKDFRRQRVSREGDLEDNKMADVRSDEDNDFASVETPKSIAKEHKEDYFEKSRKLKDFRRQRVSREDDLEDNKMVDARSDEDDNFASMETPKLIAKERKEDYFEKSRKLKDFRRQRVSREDDLEDNKMADARSDEDDNFGSVETLKPIARDQKENYYDESRKFKDLRRRRVSKDDKQSVDEFHDEKMPDGKSTTTFLSKHRDSNVEIHVANVNLKIQDNEITRKKDCAIMKSNKSQDSSDSVDAIEIKINLSRGDTRRGGKFVEDDRLESLELLEANNQRDNWATRKKCCRKRRRSLPEGFESVKRARKNDEDRQQQQFSYTAKKIKNRNRQKARKSMDDELLMNYELLRKENIAEDRNFHLEMAKTFNLPWPREKNEEKENSDSITAKNINEEEKIMISRNDKHSFNGRTVPSPSYNSSMDSTMDFDKFDVAPHNSSDTEPEQPEIIINEARYGKRKMRLEDRERYRNPTNYGNSDELACINAFELNLNTVPIYTTKDGRITYSPNRNYTFRALIMEARQREGYPPIRKLHYPMKQPMRNQRRETNNQRSRNYKKWWEEERTDNKRRNIDAVKSKRIRTHLDDIDNRTRTKKYDNRRKDTRIISEMEYASDEQSRNYSVDCSVGQNRTSDFISGSSKIETIVNQPQAVESAARRNDILRLVDTDPNNSMTSFKGGGKIVDLDDFRIVGDGKNVAKTFEDREDKETIVSKIFQGQELEISGRKPEKNCCDRLESRRNTSFFRDSRLWLKTPMASPLVNLEKRLGWDIEQDCQTLLSDSGLESSTTYVEASKDSSRRIIQRWADNSFGNEVEISRSNVYETVEHQEKTQETNRFLETETERLIEDQTETIETNENPVDAEIREISPIITEEETKNIAEEVIITKPKLTLELESSMEKNRMSEIVKSLDLAIVNQIPNIFKEVRSKNKNQEGIHETRMPAKIFQRDKDVKYLMNKVSEALTRRASSGDAESRGSRNVFFRESGIETIDEKTEESARFLEDEEETIVEDNNQDTRTIHNDILNHSKSPEPFENACKDFLIDTSTSFSSCLRLRVPEPLSDLPTESEVSQLEDTATRFASESMDFKEISRENKNFTFSRDENSGNDCRDSFLSTITENAVASDDCSRKSGENREDSSRNSPEKAPILSFSGQIRDSRHEESVSKSPPCLISEVSLPKNINDSPKSSPQHCSKICDDEIDKKTQEFEDFVSTQPKIPKMIIRNVRSRPPTPTLEEVQENTRESQLFEVEMQLNETIEDCKIPKMKIKLEEKPKIRENQEIIVDALKNVPRVKIKKIRRSSTSRSPMRTEKLPLVGKLSRQPSETEITMNLVENPDNSNTSSSYKFTLIEKISEKIGEKIEEDTKQDRIPKLTIKKQELTGSVGTCSVTAKKRQSRSPGESSSRKKKSTSRHSSQKKEETRSQERRTNSLDNESNTDSQSLSEKVPKVIIKRTSPSAEFKCELSKEGRDAITKDSKWQPEVKLQRSWVLDCMAKEPGGVKVALKMLEGVMARKERMQLMVKKSRDWNGSISDCDNGKTTESSGNLAIGNNRRKSFDEFVNNYRRLSREKAEYKQRIFMDSIKIEAIARKSETCKENTIEKKPENIGSDKNSRNYDENLGEVIKLDSSDESQTTIEILPASMDNSQTEMENIIMADGNLSKLYSDEAIPTQFELELEIVDNSTVDSLDVPIPLPSDASLEDDSTSTVDNLQRIERFKPCIINEDDGSTATDLGCEKFTYSDESVGNAVRSENVCCSDSLVKEVLAAKETLKRCFINSKNITRTKLKPRTKTAAEKKQGFHFVSIDAGESSSKSERVVFQEEEKSNAIDNTARSEKNSRAKVKEEKSYSRDKHEKYRKSWGDKRSKEETNSLGKSPKRSSVSSSTSSSGISRSNGKSRDNYGENSKSKKNGNNDKNSKHRNIGNSSEKNNDCNITKMGKIEDSSSGIMKSYKIPKISKIRDVNDETMKQEIRSTPSPTKVMPVLESQVQLNFELTGSDRDTSRSPPVITKHEERETNNVLPKIIEDTTHSDKLDSITKQDSEAVTFADIVSQLAYHEKATIRHRRYCTLCERWFPTAARHRRHLTGYQHRHTELTQRRTVHALFMLFTGKPCPRLLPASIVRTDCLPGEPTPLQIAVQDVAISLEDGARLKPKDVISEKDD